MVETSCLMIKINPLTIMRDGNPPNGRCGNCKTQQNEDFAKPASSLTSGGIRDSAPTAAAEPEVIKKGKDDKEEKKDKK